MYLNTQTHTHLSNPHISGSSSRKEKLVSWHFPSDLPCLQKQNKANSFSLSLYKAQIYTFKKINSSKINLHIRVARTTYKIKKTSENTFIKHLVCFLHNIALKTPRSYNIYTDIKQKNKGRTTVMLCENAFNWYPVKELLFYSN